ncbi:MAG: insulinase family protein [Verrucomicrobiota bacterium]
MPSRPAPAACALFLFFALCFAATLRAAPWLEVDGDLPPHPQLRVGTLPNGMRYLILPNAQPKDRISLRLLVSVGSLHENDDELGLAHFVEHMAFRGTRKFPADSLTAALQRLGVGLGPDNTAFTSYDHTFYHLELPDASDATLREGLDVFREYAEGITFDATLLERERGVIASEQATRNTPHARSGEANMRFLWPTARAIRRPVGGEPATIRALKRDQFVAFYDAWYRPERMAVIVVGDIEPEAVARALEEELGRIAPRGPARLEPADLEAAAASSPDVAIFADPGLLGVVLSFEHPVPRPRVRDTLASRIPRLHEALAFNMLHRRLQSLAHQPGASYVSPQVSLLSGLRRWQVASISVSGKIDDWKQVASDVELEHRRAFQFGFTSQELAVARANLIAAHEHAVRTSATWPSSWIASQLQASVIDGQIFALPQVAQRDLADAIVRVTEVDCLEAFRRVWTGSAPHVFIAAHPAFKITRAEIAATLNKSRSREAIAYKEAANAATVFGYDRFGPTGKLLHVEHVADLDLRLAHFVNGVRLNHKQTAFEAETVMIRMRVGEGKLTQPPDRPGLDLLANISVTGGGVGRHSAQEMVPLLAGRALRVGFNVQSDACTFTARCAKRDLAFTLQVIAAHLSDAAFRTEVMRDARASFSSMYSGLTSSTGGMINLHAMRALTGDRRFGTPTADELFSRTIAEVKEWIAPQLTGGAIEMSVVGDVTWEEALAAVAETIGALPDRASRRVGNNVTAQPAKPPTKPKVILVPGGGAQGAIAWYWPMPSIADVHEERRCRLLAEVLKERCRVRLREELGAAYSTSAGFDEIHGFPSLSYCYIYAEVAPRHLDAAVRIFEQEASSLSREGVQEDEFLRVRQPFLRSRADDVRLNSYWAGTVLSDAQQYPERLEYARTRNTDSAAITRDDLSALARRYLAPANSFKFVAAPLPNRPASGSATEAGKAAR